MMMMMMIVMIMVMMTTRIMMLLPLLVLVMVLLLIISIIIMLLLMLMILVMMILKMMMIRMKPMTIMMMVNLMTFLDSYDDDVKRGLGGVRFAHVMSRRCLSPLRIRSHSRPGVATTTAGRPLRRRSCFGAARPPTIGTTATPQRLPTALRCEQTYEARVHANVHNRDVRLFLCLFPSVTSLARRRCWETRRSHRQ
jgi:hypothetical protein